MSGRTPARRELHNWDRLRVFAEVSRTGSVAGAAEALGVTAPAVSQQLRRLESELGTRLVEPMGRGIVLTSAGHRVAREARGMARALGELVRALPALAGEAAGPVRIGAPMSVLAPLLAPALARLQTTHPDLEPQLVDGEASDFLARLADYGLDAAIVERWPSDAPQPSRGLAERALLREPVHIVVPQRLAAPEPRSLREALAGLGETPWVVCPPGSGALETLRQLTRAHGRTARIAHLISSYPAQLELVAAGLACALVPASAAECAPGTHRLAVDTGIERTIGLLTRAGDDRHAVTALVDALAAGGAEPAAPTPPPP
ncbi:LysR family transcriptional regulator [Brevibacterium sp. BRM-1]|uniref:LysR family transcriptional regulator n=1 Tax=Brevibacterium sp. BRM-1 TaxID=2999062 RepID=UPI00227E4694|nr:LysR family transcriptional regulator [Brevibacterium sp. BRM-1]WAL41299.1 LysR family transcriptional regulator [Brevibacterium sp. BRM-1]